ncbi:dihydroorotate dehydrogenase electron transfer subunit [Nitriliruptoraceae bacterium ZYF776]|nr:dihydroorotate dehydrogenase electron transfer subunit [Profundirhabdus halotolerans]
MSRRLRAGQVRGRLDRDDTPVLATCEVLARRRQGAYWLLSFSAKEIAERARPGQFVNIAVEARGALLRRPFSIARVSRQGPFAGTVDVVFDAHGPGTEWLTGLDTHDVIDVVGPLGTPFPLPKQRVPCLLVGGGYGTAPLFFLAEHLQREGLRVDLIAGAATGDRLLDVIEAKRSSASVTFTTEDGSYGTRGRVTDVLEEVADRCKSAVVYACGPNAMLRAVSERCAELELPVQVAVEERMACGVGICFTCVLPVRTKDGEVRMKRACLDGPVFNGARVAWEESRFDLGPGLAVPDDEEDGVPERLTDDDLWGDEV